MRSPTGMESQTRGLRDKDLRDSRCSFIIHFNKQPPEAPGAESEGTASTELTLPSNSCDPIHTRVPVYIENFFVRSPNYRASSGYKNKNIQAEMPCRILSHRRTTLRGLGYSIREDILFIKYITKNEAMSTTSRFMESNRDRIIARLRRGLYNTPLERSFF